MATGDPGTERPMNADDAAALRVHLAGLGGRANQLRRVATAVAVGHVSSIDVPLVTRLDAAMSTVDAVVATLPASMARADAERAVARHVRAAMHALDTAHPAAGAVTDEVAVARRRRNDELRAAKLRHPTTFLIHRKPS
jgi:hypothetical protein